MATSTIHIGRLPDNILLEILSYLPVKDRCISGRVCRRWRKIVADNSLWRHVDLLPYKLNLHKMWKIIRAHLSECLQTLRIASMYFHSKTRAEVKPALSLAMLKDLQERCPSLAWLHLEPGRVTEIPNASLLPSSLTHLTLRKCFWEPHWLKGSAEHFSNLVYLDLSNTVRVDNHDMKDIGQFTQLRTLKLDNCYRLSEPGLQEIAKTLTSLTSLSLQCCDTTDLVVHHMARHLTALRDVDLSGSKSLTESCLPSLVEGLTDLEQLSLNNCKNITANALMPLQESTSLRRISLVHVDAPILESDVAPWRENMPHCTINIAV
ncbi:F-box/LRR-repeat protein 12-like [Littorina saxatilis]|uniref:F-box domain-containing protein n=1 Tax=Littorina saxatilis TaxID=31220 RepID=A0AAN9B7J0_9CAEN